MFLSRKILYQGKGTQNPATGCIGSEDADNVRGAVSVELSKTRKRSVNVLSELSVNIFEFSRILSYLAEDREGTLPRQMYDQQRRPNHFWKACINPTTETKLIYLA